MDVDGWINMDGLMWVDVVGWMDSWMDGGEW